EVGAAPAAPVRRPQHVLPPGPAPATAWPAQTIWTAQTISRRAQGRGEIDLAHSPPAVLTMPFDLVRHDLLMNLKPLRPARIQSIVDELFLPLAQTTLVDAGSAGLP